jgi:hypothetical protein
MAAASSVLQAESRSPLRRTEILETDMWFKSGIDRDGNEDPDRRKDPPTREWSAKEAERLIRLRNTFETRYYRAL